MRLIGLVSAALIASIWVQQASACRVPRSLEDDMLFWTEPPEERGPDEVVLEVQYLGTWEDPHKDVVVTNCGPVRYYRYSVKRPLQGQFDKPEILLASYFGELGSTGQRYIVVGRMESTNDAWPPYFRARLAPLEQRLPRPREQQLSLTEDNWTVASQVRQLPALPNLQ